jgi:hypothetical protein
MLQVIIDLTTLEKCGKFKPFRAFNLSLQRQTWATSGSAVFSCRVVESSLELSCLER